MNSVGLRIWPQPFLFPQGRAFRAVPAPAGVVRYIHMSAAVLMPFASRLGGFSTHAGSPDYTLPRIKKSQVFPAARDNFR